MQPGEFVVLLVSLALELDDALLEDLLGKRATCEKKGHTMGKRRPGGPSKAHGDVGATP